MEDQMQAAVVAMVNAQREYFKSQATKSLKFRIDMLNKFRSVILKYETRIAEALWLDLHKSPEEAYLTETSIVLQEIGNHLKHLKNWASPKSVPTPLPVLLVFRRISLFIQIAVGRW